jgi:hypothetical protein
MIAIEQWPLEETRTPENSCIYLATCTTADQHFEARSRRSAPAELARVLVAAGIPDGPIVVIQAGISGCMRYPSLHRMARRTYTEGDRPLRRIPYSTPLEQAANRSERPENRGSAPLPAVPPSAMELPAISLVPETVDA